MQTSKIIKPKRNSSIELLRIISMLSIIICHFATHGGFEFAPFSLTVPRLWWNFIELGGNFGVDIFVLISGYFLIENTNLSFNFRQAMKFWGQLFFYSVLIICFSFAIGREIKVFDLIKAVFPITSSLWWFASTYFVMYLLHPYLNLFLRNLDKKTYQGFLVLIFILWSLIPTLAILFHSDYQSNPLIQFVTLYSIAGYIKLHGFNPKLKCKHYTVLFIIFIFITYLSSVIMIKPPFGIQIEFIHTNHLFFYGRLMLPMLLSAITFFMIFVTMRPFYSRAINIIASTTFGIYLLHDHPFTRSFLWLDFFKNANFQESLLIIPYSIFACISIFLAGLIIDLIRQYLFEKPYLNIIKKAEGIIIRPFSYIINAIKKIIFGE